MHIPLSLYIHIPWCVRKCPYCDFNSHEVRSPIPEQDYIEKLLFDLRLRLPEIGERPIHSIFIGGGTPSLFSASAYQALFKELSQILIIPSGIEITLEANPGASDQQNFSGYREAGINRLSIGVQSWDADKLKILGRIHNPDQAALAVVMAKNAGFDNFNIDIMHGLPQQNLAAAMDDLEKTIACQATHISWYQLTLEPNTYFHHFPPALPEDEMLWEIQEQGQKLLRAAGFNQYEISAYCRENRHSRHNINYWQFGDYIGIGAGAHSKITLKNCSVWRYWNVKNPRDYLYKTLLIDGQCEIAGSELLLEFLMNALRLHQTIPLSLIAERTGLAENDIYQKLLEKQDPELFSLDKHSMTTTALGKRFLNHLLTRFL